MVSSRYVMVSSRYVEIPSRVMLVSPCSLRLFCQRPPPPPPSPRVTLITDFTLRTPLQPPAPHPHHCRPPLPGIAIIMNIIISNIIINKDISILYVRSYNSRNSDNLYGYHNYSDSSILYIRRHNSRTLRVQILDTTWNDIQIR